tara:strand:+ start:3 stop:2084 length:2082 start_codon:yes stop_codon:yes gene_type:complete
MAKRPLPKAGKARNMVVNQFTVSKSVQFPEFQDAVKTATGNGGGKKDDTVTKDEFNSGFQDGVGQIKDGFSSLGAGLGPLQIIVDFVKGFVSKIGNIFTIFKGLFNIIMSIPRAIAEAFKKKDKEDSKKDKDEEKKDKKKEKKADKKHKEGLEETRKDRKGLFGFLRILQPVLIIGAIAAISYGLIKLYNWLAKKGLFEYFAKLGEQISFQINRLRMTFTRMFKDGEDSAHYRELQAENANIQAGRILKDGFSKEEQAKLDRQKNAVDKTMALVEILETRGVAAEYGPIDQKRVIEELVTNKYGFSDEGIFAKNRETGESYVTDALGTNVATKEEMDARAVELDAALEFNMEDYNALYSGDQLGYKIDPNSRIIDPKFNVDHSFFSGLTMSMEEGEYAQRKITGPDGELLTIDKITEDFNKKYAHLGDKFTPMTVEEVGQQLNRVDDLIVLSDGTIAKIDEADQLGGGFVKVKEDNSGSLVQDTSEEEQTSLMIAAVVSSLQGPVFVDPSVIKEQLYEDEKEISARLINELLTQDGLIDVPKEKARLETVRKEIRREDLRTELEKDGELDSDDTRLLDLLTTFRENEQNVDNYSRRAAGRFRYEWRGGLADELQVSGKDTTSQEVIDELIEAIRVSLGPDVTTGEAADVYNTFMNNSTFANTTLNTAVEYATQDTSVTNKDVATFMRNEAHFQ